MTKFAITMVMLILFGIQHLLNWFWRKNYKDDSLIVLGFLLMFISVLVSLGGVLLIINWGNKL